MFDYPLASRFEGVGSSPVRDLLAILSRPEVISFAGGIPDPDLFAYDDLRRCFDYVLTHQAARALQYSATEGEYELREQAACQLSNYLPTSPNQVQITSGSQEGLFLVGQVLIGSGDVVLVEQPTYLAAIQAFRLAGARLISVDTDGDGVVPEDLAAKLTRYSPKFVYLIPTFQNPTGRTMTVLRREQVADILRTHGTALVEDDPYSGLRYDGSAVAPIAALPGMAEQTILLNSASKIIAPGTRIGWVRAGCDVLRALTIAKQAVGLHSPVTEQLTIARYLQTCDLNAHLGRVAETYRKRRDAMLTGLAAVLPDRATVTKPDGGMFCWVDLHDNTDTTAALVAAVDHGVAYVPGATFHAEHPNLATMRLSFVTNDDGAISEGLRRLAHALDW